nr:hypothetical protein [Streptomyces sp. YIM 132580]
MAAERIRWPAVVDRAREIVESYEGGVTLRQVMYRLVSEGMLPHTAPMYRRLSAQLAKARREGRLLDLIDTVREIHVPPAWPGADSFVAQMPGWLRLDRTEGQEHALYVAAEKDTLRQQLTGWLAAADPVLSLRHRAGAALARTVDDRRLDGTLPGLRRSPSRCLLVDPVASRPRPRPEGAPQAL